MKTSLAHLPVYHQQRLTELAHFIVANLPQTEMVILFGSYARGTQVEFDERVEFGVSTYYSSDYDILVVTSEIHHLAAYEKLHDIEEKYIRANNFPHKPDLGWIQEDIERLNQQLSEGRYFYTELQRDGIALYDSGRCKLAHCRTLNFEEIQAQAQEYFEDKHKRASLFLSDARSNYDKGEYSQAAFYLHQACENLLHAILLTFKLKSGKLHNLHMLIRRAMPFARQAINTIFPRDTPQEIALFNLLKDSYVEARYNKNFVIPPEELNTLFNRLEQLREATLQICTQKIQSYAPH